MEQSSTQGHYTVPEISIANSKDWFIYFRFTHQGKEYLRKYREGINRVKDKAEKMALAKKIRQEREDWLKMGWNPIIDPDFKLRQIKVNRVKSSCISVMLWIMPCPKRVLKEKAS